MADRPAMHVIRTPRELAALRSPVRQRLLGLLEEQPGSSVAELAARLALPAESLYYHVQKLVDVGLVIVSGRRRAGRRYESLYGLRSVSLSVDPQQRSTRFIEALKAVYDGALRNASRGLERALEWEKTSGAGPRTSTALRQRTVRLSTEDERRLRALLLELDGFLERHDDPEGERVIDVTTVLCVRPPRL